MTEIRYHFLITHEELSDDGPESQGYFDRLPKKDELQRATQERLNELFGDKKAGDWYKERAKGVLTLEAESFKHYRKPCKGVVAQYRLGELTIWSRVFAVDVEPKGW